MRRMHPAGNVARMKETRNAYKLGRPTRTWEIILKKPYRNKMLNSELDFANSGYGSM
jgi:hypothetical protein